VPSTVSRITANFEKQKDFYDTLLSELPRDFFSQRANRAWTKIKKAADKIALSPLSLERPVAGPLRQ